MGRACGKVTMKMKQIQNEKVRKSAFNQRNKGLRNKVLEFSKNFGVEACLIVYDGDGDGKPMTWPQNSETIQSMLTKYEQQKIETTPKEFNVKDYFANKKNMVEAEILSVRKKIVMNKYPTWSRSFNSLGREQLKGFMDIVDLKIQDCNQRIDMLKNMQQSDQTSFLQNTSHLQSVVLENVTALESSEPDDPMNPLVDISEMVDFSDHKEWDDLMPQKNVFSSNSSEHDDLMNPLVDISEMMDFSDHIEWDDLMPQKNVYSSNSSQLYVSTPLKPLDNISEMVDFTDLIDLTDPTPQKNVFSSNSTSQLDVMNSIPQMQYVYAPLKPLDNITLPSVSSTCQLGEFVEGAAQHADFNDLAAPLKQHDVFEGRYVFFLSEIEQECAALDAFDPQPRYGF